MTWVDDTEPVCRTGRYGKHLTVQRTGRLLNIDRGLRVMSSVQRLTARLSIPPGPADQRLTRIMHGLLELEPNLRRLAKSSQLEAFRTALQQL